MPIVIDVEFPDGVPGSERTTLRIEVPQSAREPAALYLQICYCQSLRKKIAQVDSGVVRSKHLMKICFQIYYGFLSSVLKFEEKKARSLLCGLLETVNTNPRAVLFEDLMNAFSPVSNDPKMLEMVQNVLDPKFTGSIWLFAVQTQRVSFRGENTLIAKMILPGVRGA